MMNFKKLNDVLEDVNYEDVFLEDIQKILSSKFYIKNEKTLFIYLYIRFLLIENFKNRKIKTKKLIVNEYFIDFIIDECCIANAKNKIIYRNITFKKNYGNKNNIKNSLESWCFRATMEDLLLPTGDNISVSNYIFKEYEALILLAKSKTNKYKKNVMYKYFLLDFLLKELNKNFNVYIVNEPKMNENFLYDDSFYEKCLPYELVCSRMISLSNFSKKSLSISEYDLENFLISHLESIEKGLSYVKRQVVLKYGRIDILARDINNNLVIIELKVKSDDKRIIWQSIHYKSELESMLNKKNVRVITLAPDYDNSILFDLKKLGFVDIYKFKLDFLENRINDIIVSKM